eukprot:7652418-Pyramimonas_sp.AAC.1
MAKSFLTFLCTTSTRSLHRWGESAPSSSEARFACGPIRRGTRGYICTTNQSDAGRVGTFHTTDQSDSGRVGIFHTTDQSDAGRMGKSGFSNTLGVQRAVGLKRTREAEQEVCRRCKTARQMDLRVMLAGPKGAAVGESGELDTG